MVCKEGEAQMIVETGNIQITKALSGHGLGSILRVMGSHWWLLNKQMKKHKIGFIFGQDHS